MEFSVSNISYLSKPKAVRSGQERQRRQQEMKKKKGEEQGKKSSGNTDEGKTEHKGLLLDLTV